MGINIIIHINVRSRISNIYLSRYNWGQFNGTSSCMDHFANFNFLLVLLGHIFVVVPYKYI